MKTTIELRDALFEQARRMARDEGSSLRALVEEGLQLALNARRNRRPQPLDLPTYGGSGLTDEFKTAGWAGIRDALYRDHGA